MKTLILKSKALFTNEQEELVEGYNDVVNPWLLRITIGIFVVILNICCFVAI